MTDTHSRDQAERPPNPPEDATLVRFLQANVAPVSPPSSELEDQIMVAISQQDIAQQNVVRATSSRSQEWHWRSIAVIGAGIAVIGGGVLQVQQWLVSPEFATAQLEELEDYLTSSFDISDSAKPLAEYDWGSRSQVSGSSQSTKTDAVLNLEQ